DLGFGEPDGGLTGSGRPPLAWWVDGERHVAGVFTVGAALDVEYGRLVRQCHQSHRGAVTGNRRLGLATYSGLVEDLPGRVLRDSDQRGAPLTRCQQST